MASWEFQILNRSTSIVYNKKNLLQTSFLAKRRCRPSNRSRSQTRPCSARTASTRSSSFAKAKLGFSRLTPFSQEAWFKIPPATLSRLVECTRAMKDNPSRKKHPLTTTSPTHDLSTPPKPFRQPSAQLCPPCGQFSRTGTISGSK